MNKIDVRTDLTAELFNEQYYNTQPVIAKGAIKNTSSFRKWDFDYMRLVIGSRIVNVSYSESGVYDFTVEGKMRKMEMSFDKALGLFLDSHSSKSYYLQQYNIPDHFPNLLPDVEVPKLNSATDLEEQLNLWMGGVGCVTPLHYDKSHNFLMQVRGKKMVTFFAPSDSPYLYPNPDERRGYVSQLDIDYPDNRRFPLYKKATPFQCLIEEGDLIYIPPKWWHQVRSLDVSISINSWWSRFDIIDGIGMESISVEHLCGKIEEFKQKGVTSVEINALLQKAIEKNYPNIVNALLKVGVNPDVDNTTT